MKLMKMMKFGLGVKGLNKAFCEYSKPKKLENLYFSDGPIYSYHLIENRVETSSYNESYYIIFTVILRPEFEIAKTKNILKRTDFMVCKLFLFFFQ